MTEKLCYMTDKSMWRTKEVGVAMTQEQHKTFSQLLVRSWKPSRFALRERCTSVMGMEYGQGDWSKLKRDILDKESIWLKPPHHLRDFLWRKLLLENGFKLLKNKAAPLLMYFAKLPNIAYRIRIKMYICYWWWK